MRNSTAVLQRNALNSKTTEPMKSIEFNRTKYDPQIDYIKGLCILFVIWTHCINRKELGYMLFPFWGDTAVPIFLIIQVFHYYKKGVSTRIPSTLKLWKRILFPYLIMTAFMFIVQYYIYYDNTNGMFSPTLYWNKRGPGSYYIFIYLEFAFVIPFFAILFKNLSTKWLFFIFVILSQIVEIACSITQCPDNIYRIVFFRYIFLIFIGYLLAQKGLELNRLTKAGAIISMFFICLFAYTDYDLEPWFCTHLDLWPLCHWVCYFYIAYFFLAFLKYTYSKLSHHIKIRTFIEIIGIYSYEIYLFQIFYYATLRFFILDYLSNIDDYALRRIIYVLVSTIICAILPAIILNQRKKYEHIIKN